MGLVPTAGRARRLTVDRDDFVARRRQSLQGGDREVRCSHEGKAQATHRAVAHGGQTVAYLAMGVSARLALSRRRKIILRFSAEI